MPRMIYRNDRDVAEAEKVRKFVQKTYLSLVTFSEKYWNILVAEEKAAIEDAQAALAKILKK